MFVKDVVECWPEVLKGEYEGIIYIERVAEPQAFEADPDWVFAHTCLLDEERLIMHQIGEKLAGRDSRGSFIALGAMGSGKSHQLLLAYHLFKYPEKANKWLAENDLKGIEIPSDSSIVVAQVKQVGDKYRYLWDLIFEQLGMDDLVGKFEEHSPGKKTLEQAFRRIGATKKPIAIILDEVEAWLNEIKNSEDKERNRFFLEKLAELASSANFKIILITALRGDFDEPKRSLSRTQTITVNLSASGKRMKIVLFRLFREIKREKAKSIVKSYGEAYRRNKDHGLLYGEEPEIEEDMLVHYPFHPFMLKTLTQRYTSHPSYQSTRGLLYLLSSVVRDQFESKELFLLGDVSVKRYEGLLSILDAELVRKAKTSCEEIADAKIPMGGEILSTLFFYSISDKEKGATEQDVLFSSFRPEVNPSEILHSLVSVSETCTYVRRAEGKYILGPESPDSMVKKKSSPVVLDLALSEISAALGDLTKKSASFLLEFKDDLFEDNRELKVIFTLKREGKDEQFKERLEEVLTSRSPQYQNSIVFIAPERGADLTQDEELISAAKKAYAARELAKAGGTLAQEFERIMGEKIGLIKTRLRSVDWILVRWVKRQEGVFDFRPVPIEGERLSWTEIRNQIRNTWGIEQVKDAVKVAVKNFRQMTLKKTSEDFTTFRSNPVLVDKEDLLKAVGELCGKGQVAVDQGGKTYHDEWIDVEMDAKVLDPSMLPPPVTSPPTPPMPPTPPTPTMVEKEKGVTPTPPTPPTVPTEALLLEVEKISQTGVTGIISDIEKRLLEHGLLDDVHVISPFIQLKLSLDRPKEVEELGSKMSPAGVANLEADIKLQLSDMTGKELIEWLKKLPNKPGFYSVKGEIKK